MCIKFGRYYYRKGFIFSQNEYLRLNGNDFKSGLVVEHLKVWTQLIIMKNFQFVVSNYMPLLLPENKPFVTRQVHQYQFH